MTAIFPADVNAAVVASVQTGRIAPLGPHRVPSGFVKHPIESPVDVTVRGLAGDEQADHSVHGGPDKAVYGYASSNYPLWRHDFPEHAERFAPAALGENLTIDGLDETGVCVGDIVRIGTVTLQVTQPRQPCFKFALRFDDPRLPPAMVKNGRCGWYYRVLAPGVLMAGDSVTLERRANPLWTIARFQNLIARRSMNEAERAELVALEGLAVHWVQKIRGSAFESAPPASS